MSVRLVRNLVAGLIGLVLGMVAHKSFASVVFPAGTVVSVTGAACPTGFTAYAAGEGRVVIGKGTLGAFTYALGDTGGSALHTLTVAEVPALSGTTSGGSVSGTTDAGVAHQHTIGTASGTGSSTTRVAAGSATAFGSMQSNPESAHTHTFTGSLAGLSFSTTGGGGAHENRQPYIALTQCTLDADFTGGAMDPEAYTALVMLVMFAVGLVAGQQR